MSTQRLAAAPGLRSAELSMGSEAARCTNESWCVDKSEFRKGRNIYFGRKLIQRELRELGIVQDGPTVTAVGL